nr:TrkA C-terminal domain-containing protein [Enterovirga sp.]
MIDVFEFEDGFATLKTRSPLEAVGKTLEKSALSSECGVTLVGVKRPKADFTHARPETVIEAGDLTASAVPPRGNFVQVSRGRRAGCTPGQPGRPRAAASPVFREGERVLLRSRMLAC